jgi:isocitrate/isopropylmalate dehydrogenase
MRDERTIVVLEGDETGQELLEESLRVLEPDVIGVELEFPRFDLSLERRRETDNESCTRPRRRSASTGSG